MRTVVVVVACLALPACVSIPENAKYVEPPASAAVAVVQNWGVMGGATTTCQFPGSSRVCRATLTSIDGKVPSIAGQTTRVAAGEHIASLLCLTWQGGPVVFGGMKAVGVALRGPFEAGRRYYVRCVIEAGTARLWLAGSEDGGALSEFVVESEKR
jgi:hypothetical protein